MSITTYAELQTAVGNWLNRSDLTSVIPDFISLAESKIINGDGRSEGLRHYNMEKRATATFDAQYTELPDDFLQPIRLHIQGKHSHLEPMSVADMQSRRYSSEDTTGAPCFYAITGGEIEVYPTPDGTYTGELLYYRTLPALSVSNTSNWLLTDAPDVYLYGTLMQSAPYLVDDERLTTWAALYQSALDGLQRTGDRAKWGGAGLKLRIKR